MDQLYRELLTRIGEDPNREGLLHTPSRAAKTFEDLTSGYSLTLEQVVGESLFDAEGDDLVIVKDIEFYSLCEHHLLPFFGRCHIGYLPDKKIIGLSKIPQLVDMYARRLQVQENLTRQIAEALLESTQAAGVGVVVEAQHLCMMMRGIKKQHATMKTSAMLGVFRNQPETRMEFLGL